MSTTNDKPKKIKFKISFLMLSKNCCIYWTPSFYNFKEAFDWALKRAEEEKPALQLIGVEAEIESLMKYVRRRLNHGK